LPEAVPADVITTALYARFRSRQEHTFGEKLLSAGRFGLIRSVTRLRSGT
jgi:6-phosphogluconate dehydrogenase